MRMKAFNLQRVDKEHDMYMQAWLNHQVAATTNKGSEKKPKYEAVYPSFKQFFDYENKLREINGEVSQKLSKRQKRMAKIALKTNKNS